MTLAFFLKVLAIWFAIALVAGILMGKGMKTMDGDTESVDVDEEEEARILDALLAQQAKTLGNLGPPKPVLIASNPDIKAAS